MSPMPSHSYILVHLAADSGFHADRWWLILQLVQDIPGHNVVFDGYTF